MFSPAPNTQGRRYRQGPFLWQTFIKGSLGEALISHTTPAFLELRFQWRRKTNHCVSMVGTVVGM